MQSAAGNEVTHMGQQNTKPIELWASGGSDTGRKRANNEDSFLVEEIKGRSRTASSLICVVADGMGGQDHGEVASQAAVATFHDQTSKLHKVGSANGWLDYSTRLAHAEIKRQSARLNVTNGMGSTLIAALFCNDRCFLANVGDSRAYLLRQGQISRQTRDHSLMELMLERGLIQPDDVYSHPRRGEITHFLGQDEDVTADLYEIAVQRDDVILLCSDGLWEMVRDPDIESILAANTDPHDAVHKLVAAANQAGGVDNITAVVTRII